MTIDDKMRLVSFSVCVCVVLYVCVCADFGSYYVLSTLMYLGQNRAAICSTSAEPNKFPLSRLEKLLPTTSFAPSLLFMQFTRFNWILIVVQ